jgi:hypothetical protein
VLFQPVDISFSYCFLSSARILYILEAFSQHGLFSDSHLLHSRSFVASALLLMRSFSKHYTIDRSAPSLPWNMNSAEPNGIYLALLQIEEMLRV